ncbi:DUF4198 domain-containing protein [Marimonas lutisalis]|uniref:DUF4198 domain-containing protein n=1 Tax=Marimonas lutisalis TaxID=2545756 RepID=UPI0010F72393|nr:DUF4198 domain-containing protein [Marimonas lutisalis]
MRAFILCLLATVCALGPVRATLAHEFWIEPEEYQVDSPGRVTAALINGQDFRGTRVAWFDSRIARAEWRQGDTRAEIAGRPGDRPALSLGAPGEGLLQLVYVSTPSKLTYSEWAKFSEFVQSKGFPDAVERHRARGLPETGFREIYTRYCKSLIAVGDGAGADAPAGMEAEIVALANPYTDDMGGGLPVQILYRGAPRAGALLDVFERSPTGNVTKTQIAADAEGRLEVPVRAGHVYLLDSVVLRESAAEDAVWESLWASLTFAVPD